jgi:hypothetical protein
MNVVCEFCFEMLTHQTVLAWLRWYICGNVELCHCVNGTYILCLGIEGKCFIQVRARACAACVHVLEHLLIVFK